MTKTELLQKLLNGETITATFIDKKGNERQMTCSIAPKQSIGYEGKELYNVIEQTAKGDQFRCFNMGALING